MRITNQIEKFLLVKDLKDYKENKTILDLNNKNIYKLLNKDILCYSDLYLSISLFLNLPINYKNKPSVLDSKIYNFIKDNNNKNFQEIFELFIAGQKSQKDIINFLKIYD